MARTEAEKYSNRHYQDRNGQWSTMREINHDSRYCDICDSEDVEQPSELVTGNGWYGGVRILWGGNPHRPQLTEVLCRQHFAEHFEAEHSAPRTPVMIDDIPELAYFCPAHQAEHYDFGSRDQWKALKREAREFTR